MLLLVVVEARSVPDEQPRMLLLVVVEARSVNNVCGGGTVNL